MGKMDGPRRAADEEINLPGEVGSHPKSLLNSPEARRKRYIHPKLGAEFDEYEVALRAKKKEEIALSQLHDDPSFATLRAFEMRSAQLDRMTVQKYRLMLLQRHEELKHSCDPDFATLFSAADTNDDGVIDRAEFHRLCCESAKTDWDHARVSSACTSALFWHLDIEDSGSISRKEMKWFLSKKQTGWGTNMELDRKGADELKQLLKKRASQLRQGSSAANTAEVVDAVFKEADI